MTIITLILISHFLAKGLWPNLTRIKTRIVHNHRSIRSEQARREDLMTTQEI